MSSQPFSRQKVLKLRLSGNTPKQLPLKFPKIRTEYAGEALLMKGAANEISPRKTHD